MKHSIAAGVLLLWALACNTDRTAPERRLSVDSVPRDSIPGDSVLVVPPIHANVSEPVARTADAATPKQVYVALPAGMLKPGASLATITHPASGTTLIVPIADRGLDPVAVPASVGDEITISLKSDDSTALQSLTQPVPALTKPIVVRTVPARGKRSVPLNARIIIIFSEPVQASSLGGIRVLTAGASVAGASSLSADGLVAEFVPAALLAPEADYVISVNGVTDLGGATLANDFASDFSTADAAATASIVTVSPALFVNPFNEAVRTFEMNATLMPDGTYSGTFSIYYAAAGYRNSGSVTCFAIVDGKTAFVGGILESGQSQYVGQDVVWRIVDSGASGAADKLSLVLPLEGEEIRSSFDFCLDRPTNSIEGEIELFDLTSGNLVVSGASNPVRPANAPAILFAGDNGSGRTDIYGTNGVAAPLTRLTAGTYFSGEPAWSSDGQRIVFTSDRASNREIWSMAWNGTQLTRLTHHDSADYSPAWSPDGSKVAFVSERDGNPEIYVMNADGSGLTRLTNHAEADLAPSWSPDGSRIAFSSDRSGYRATIHTMNADGSNVTQVTSHGDPVGGDRDFDPAWSPDGTKIAFSRFVWCEEDYIDLNWMCRWDIMVVNANGTGLTRLALPTEPVQSLPNNGLWRSVVQAREPVWSPDGSQVAATAFACFSEFHGLDCLPSSPIVIMAADGSGSFVELTSGHQLDDYRPVFQSSASWRH